MLQTKIKQRTDFNPALILGKIAQQAHIDYIDYTQYDTQTIRSYSSNLQHCWNEFMDDDLSCLPVLTNDVKNYYRWRDYCSSFLLEQFLLKEGLTSHGFTMTFKHNNFAEHFSFGTQQLGVDLYATFTHDSHLLNTIINTVRYFVYRHQIKPTMITSAPTCLNTTLSKQVQGNSCLTSLNDDNTKYYLYGIDGQIHLTAKEKYCLTAITQLRTMDDISKELCVSIKTIETHLRRVKKKLGACSRSVLYTIAKNNQLI